MEESKVDSKLLLEKIYSLIETKCPEFLFKLELIRLSLGTVNSITFIKVNREKIVKNNLDVNIVIEVSKREDWGASVLIIDRIVDITIDRNVIVTEVEDKHLKRLENKKDKTIIHPYDFTVCVPLSEFISYVPNIIFSNSIYRVYTYLYSNFNLIVDRSIDRLTTKYINSFKKAREKYPDMDIRYYNGKLRYDNTNVLSSHIWLSDTIKDFSSEQLLLISRIMFSVTQIREDIRSRADSNFEKYIKEHYPPTE